MYYGKKLFGQVNGVGEEGLIAYWPLSSDALDDGPNGLDGTESGLLTYTLGGLDFSDNGGVTVSDDDLLSPTSGFTISLDFYRYSLGGFDQMFTKRNYPANDEFQLTWYNGSLLMWIFDSTGSNYIGRGITEASLGISIDTWYNLKVTWDGTTSSTGIKIYLDDVEQTTTNSSSGTFTGMNNGIAPLYIGKYGQYMDGVLKEVKFYNQVV